MRRTTTGRAAATAAAVAAASLLLSACGTGSDVSRTSADDVGGGGGSGGAASRSKDSERPAEPEPSDSPGSPSSSPAPGGPEFSASTDPQTAEPSGDWDLQLQDVRVGEHDGFDRVVLEFSGTAGPGWGVEWTEEAVADGSGEVVPLDGDRVLTISASGTAMPEPGSFEVPQRLGPTGDVAEVQVTGWFEGYTQVFAGFTGEERPFRVFALAEPPRLVVDVRD
ncbi:hypothetical protein EXE59_16085 [Nocardioides eburneiflavus]|uniref:AMIN-like domain-containing protein n=1 Tax=Nocardioides eburneiflavus TaxID=2518372 RepID=A0A4Z1CCB9_9ACTN|nr:hypothetical protein [Nocardioides eburneiflavus]TGN65306.1 hypothetical protein EXE59_16085 [Nocardioides eburneiflavus]